MADSLGKLFVDLLLRDDSFAKDLQKAQGDVEDFGSSVTDLTDNIAGKFTLALEAGAAAIAGMAAASTVLGAEFEQQITKVGVLAGSSVQPLADAAREFGKATAFSASQAAEAMESLAQAGFKTEDIIGGTSAALALAAASGSELADATKIVATTMSQFQLTAADSTRIADVFTAALNTSQLDMEGLTLAMSYAGTVGASFGMSLEETSAAVAMFSNLGLEGSKAGTAFRMAMSQAANVSKEAERSLAKYGLTAKDINPELHNFGEILQIVGEKGITASDAMAIFGTEVGGNVAVLAQQAVDANTDFSKSFDGILSTLEDSAGMAESTAADMQVTVASAWEQATGSFEEILLSLYDMYSGPLRDLLVEVTAFLNDLGAAFQRNSIGMADGFSSAFEQLTTWLHENRNDLIMSIIDFTKGLADVAAMLASLVPYLDDIAVLMGAIWVVNQVASFASALGGAIDVVFGLQAALAALGVEITAMTGGLYLAVVAIGVIIAAVVSYIAITNDATMAAERLTAAQEKQAALAGDADTERIAHLEELLAVQKEAASAELDQIAAGKEVSKARKKELEQIVDLDAAQADLLVRQGKLVESNGELRTAASMVDEAMNTADTSKLADAYQGLGKHADELTVRSDALASEIEKMQRIAQETGGISEDTAGSAIAKATGEQGIATLEDAQVRLEALQQEIKDTRKAQQEFKGDAAKAQRDLVEETERATGATRDQTRAVEDFSKTAKDEAARTAEEQSKTRERGEQELADLYAHQQQMLEDALATDEERKQLQRDREIASIAKSFDDQIALYAGNLDEQARLQSASLETQKAARDRYAAEDAAAAAERAKKAADAVASAEEDVAKRVEQIRLDSMTESQRLEDERAKYIAQLDAQLAKELESIEGLSAEDRAAAIEKFTQETADERLLIEEDYQKKIEAAREEEEKAAREQPGKFAQWWKKTIDNVAKVIPEGFRSGLADAAKAIDSFVAGAQKAFKGIEGFVGGVVGAIAGLVEKMTGFKFSIDEVMSSVMDAVGAEGASPTAAADTASSTVNTMVDQAITFGEALSQAIGPMLEALASRIPDLLQSVAANLPVVISAIVQAVPKIADAVIGEIPRIWTAVINGIVTLVQSIAAELPGLVESIITMLPGLITTLLNAVPKIITAILRSIPLILNEIISGIPGILSAIIEGIPGIIMSIVREIPKLIVGILVAIPELIKAIVGMIPELITMIISLVPDIIISLAQSLPDLIPAIVMLIPSVVIAIIEALPKIVIALVKGIVVELIMQLPKIVGELLKGLWEGVKEMIKQMVDAIKALFSLKKDKDKGKSSAYSGIDYVPATMRTTLHQGEAVIPADRNAQRLHGGPAAAGAGAAWGGNGGGGGGPIEIAVVAEGRLLEAVQVHASAMGRANEMGKTIRRASGTKIGFSRGAYTPWAT